MSDTLAAASLIGGAASIVANTIEERSMQPNDNYVVHGAQIGCNYGARLSRLIVPKGRATMIHGMPQLTVNDCKVGTHIQSCGYCFSEENPERQAEIDRIMKAVEEDKSFFDGFMKFFGAKGLDTEDYADDIKNSVLICCKPIIVGNTPWQDGTDRLLLGGEKTLIATCELHCKYGGIIKIYSDGQEDAIQTQIDDVNTRDFTQE